MSIIPSPLPEIFVFIFGLFVGSFLNVCIWRLPAEEQVVKGRSHCRACGHTIPWYDNVPLISYVALGGKCRFCKARISWLYPAVELATGFLFLGAALRFGPNAIGIVYAALAASLLLISVIDAREKVIPDGVTLPGMGLGLMLSFLFPALHADLSRWQGLLSSVVGLAAGGGFLWAIGAIGGWVFKKEAMGGGDVKLMAMVGSVIGWQKILLVNLFLAPLLGSLVGIFLKIRYKESVIPYGPFLSIGTFAAVLWGDRIMAWYRGLFIGI